MPPTTPAGRFDPIPNGPKSRRLYQLRQFPEGVFFEMEAGRDIIEIARDGARPEHTVWRPANIQAARPQDPVDLAQLSGRILWMQVLHQLIAKREVDAAVLRVDRDAWR